MGGHGGLNILPQKSWNVYNYDNREKVRKDEEAAAREEQLKREQSRRRDAEFRLERLRQARGIHYQHHNKPTSSSSTADPALPLDANHINLFDGMTDFSSLARGGGGEEQVDRESARKRFGKQEDDGSKGSRKRRREDGGAAPAPSVGPEEEKYKLGYGLVGNGVNAPWYLSKSSSLSSIREGSNSVCSSSSGAGSAKRNGSGRKSIEELREERMKREKKENQRERAVISSQRKKGAADRRFSRIS